MKPQIFVALGVLIVYVALVIARRTGVLKARPLPAGRHRKFAVVQAAIGLVVGLGVGLGSLLRRGRTESHEAASSVADTTAAATAAPSNTLLIIAVAALALALILTATLLIRPRDQKP